MRVVAGLIGLLSLLYATIGAGADCSCLVGSGPANGWLLIHGGGNITPESKERFVALAGGPNGKFVFIPTALADTEIEFNALRAKYSSWFNIQNIVVLHTRDRDRANSDDFVEPLRNASAVFFDGGRQWRLVDAYLGTAVEREIKALLARGGVVGGSSAGASIQASYLVRGAPATPQNPDGDNTIVMSPGHETGFGLLTNSAIDQHVDARGRAHDLDSVLSAHPGLLGIGIDQAAAIVVHKDRFFVVGGEILIHDGQEHDGEPYYALQPKTGFNLKLRSIDTLGRQQSGYDWVFEVKSAARHNSRGVTTTGAGTLGLAEGATPPPQPINFECNVAVFAIGDNRYAAKRNGEHQFDIMARSLDSDELQSYACTY